MILDYDFFLCLYFYRHLFSIIKKLCLSTNEVNDCTVLIHTTQCFTYVRPPLAILNMEHDSWNKIVFAHVPIYLTLETKHDNNR